MNPAIEAHGLTRRFGPLTAVDNIDLAVEQGRIFGLVGPDGAGKTTTIRMLCGIILPTAGTAIVAGSDVVRETDQLRDRIGYMSQRFGLYGDLTVRENMLLFAELFGVSRAEREARMIDLLRFSRLTEFQNRRAEQLSGGMKQKLALACTLIHRPEVLFLDEPTTGVDPVARREFWKILSGLLQQGTTIFVSTPYMDEAERCGQVGFMVSGRLLAVGTPEELKVHFDQQVIALRGRPRDTARQVALAVPGVSDVQIMGDVLHLYVDDAGQREPQLRVALDQAAVTTLTLRQIKPSMEDVFVSLTRALTPGPSPSGSGEVPDV
jgi:ABC-2 type transport system ATP-binding protein